MQIAELHHVDRLTAPGTRMTIDPGRTHTRADGAADIEVWIVADVQDFIRPGFERLAGNMENAPVRLRTTGTAGIHHRSEMPVDADSADVRVAIRDDCKLVTRRQPAQCISRIRIQLDLVARRDLRTLCQFS